MQMPDAFASFTELVQWLADQRNDLQQPAQSLAPVIGKVLTALRHDAAFARMSGSGATCFGLYPDQASALAAADCTRAAHQGWWIVAAPLRA